MDEIPLDPVVIYYFKISTEKEDVGFSEICLRLTLTQLLGRTHVFTNADVKMYEKVFLLYYTRKGFTVDKIISIMASCFDAATVREHLTLANRQLIINEWRQFQKQHLIDVVYREAAVEMLKDWRHRCMLQQNGSKFEIKLEDIQSQVKKICDFLLWELKHRLKFATRMWLFLNDETTAKPTLKKGTATSVSLDCASIFESVKPQLNPWMVSMVERRVRQCVYPVRTTIPLQHIIQLKRLPEGTIPQLESSSRKKGKGSHHSKKRIIVQVEEPTNFESKPAAEEKILLEYQEEPASSLALQAEEPIALDCETTKYENLIDLETAMAYIEQLKSYALAKECFEALDPLEQIETCFNSGVNG